MRTKVLSWVWAAGLVILAAAPASAQSEPDTRAIRPALMLLVDSSGSMEYTAQGTDPVCSGSPTLATSTRNRWSMVVESLVGEYSNYYCTSVPRSGPGFVGQPDYNYHIDYHRPDGINLGNGILALYGDRVKFGVMTFDTLPATIQNYVDRWRTQALCEANDGVGEADYSYGHCRRLHFQGCEHAGYWLNIGARRELGDTFPVVPDGVLGGSDDLGELAAPFDGAMVSVGPPTDDPAELDTTRSRIAYALQSRRPFGPTPLAAQVDDAYEYFDNHPDVAEPAVPGAAGDGYYECRNRFIIILSDGKPNSDFRDDPLNCDQGGVCPYPLPADRVTDLFQDFGVRTAVIGFAATGDPEFPQMRQQLEDIAAAGQTEDCIRNAGLNLTAPDGSSSRVFWAQNRAQLMSAMSAIIDACVNTVPTTRTRPAFASISSGSGGQYQIQSSFQVVGGRPWRGYLERHRFTCNVPVVGPPTVVDQPLDNTYGDDFRAVLNARTAKRRLFTFAQNGVANCTLGGAQCRQQLMQTGYRRSDAGLLYSRVELDDAQVTAEMLGYDSGPGAARTTSRTQVLDFVYGRNPAPAERVNNRLGDIYRSSPTVMTAPNLDIADQSFNDFRTRALSFDAALGRYVGAQGRPGAIYVGTNDGILHAFRLEDDPGAGGRQDGEELWGFIPPYHVSRLRDQLTTHSWYVDGTPAVKDMRFGRTLANAADYRQWRTILTVGQRNGGNAYMTLDVTNPAEPDFLWQLAPDNRVLDARWLRRMGLTGSVAGLATVNVALGGVTTDVLGRRTVPASGERGVALIAGGTPEQCDATEVGCTAAQFRAGAPNCTCVHYQDDQGCAISVAREPLYIGSAAPAIPPTAIGTSTTTRRDNRRCYGAPQGQYLWVVDVETGFVLKEFGPCSVNRQVAGRPAVSPAGRCIDSPITGSVAPFPGIVGTVATRAYAGDADGRMWRFDFSDPDPANWGAKVVYDLYNDVADPRVAQRIVEAPVVSVDPEGNATLVFGSGDPDLLEGRDLNRVASITEYPTYDVAGRVTALRVRENWRISLEQGERVTGPLELFNNAVYFGTFSPSSSGNLCDFGEGRVWGVHFRLADSVLLFHAQPRQLLKRPGGFALCDPTETPTPQNEVRCVRAGDNSVVFGVGITQRPVCMRATDDSIPGVPGTRRHIQEIGGGTFDLVIQSGRGGLTGPAGGWVTNITTINLDVPQAFSRVDSWYSLIE